MAYLKLSYLGSARFWVHTLKTQSTLQALQNIELCSTRDRYVKGVLQRYRAASLWMPFDLQFLLFKRSI